MATRLIWFAQNSMQHNHDETVMSGMPETPGGRSWQPATGEASQAAATTGANDGVIPNPPRGRLALDHVTKERRQKRATLPREKKNIMHIGTCNVRTMRGLGNLDLLIKELDNINMDITGLCETRWDGEGHFQHGKHTIIYCGSSTARNGVAFIVMLHLYGQKKKAAKKAVDKARNDMEADLYTKLDEDAGKKMIYKMARQRNEYSKDVKGGTFIKDRNGKLVTSREEVLKVWEGHYSELLNHEGNMSDLELPNYVQGKLNVIEITDMEVTRGLKGMKKGREPGLDEMRTEMVDVAGEIGVRWTKRLLNTCMKQCKVPEDWRTGLIVPIWKRKGDAQDPGKYTGITLLSHIMKLLERILDKRLRERVEPELGEEQLGFRKGRGTTDGMFSLRQLVEKRLEKQGHMALAFVDLEKAFDTVPRQMAITTLRWMGAPESEVKMVEAMYENTKARVVIGSGMSNEFQVNIGLRQGSALSPLLFILVMELISRKISTTDALRKIMYADDIVIVAEHREELQGALEEWNDMFKKHGLNMNLDKTEVMWVGKQREELNIRLEEKYIKQVKNFVYLGGNISENGRVDVEVRRRIQAGANAWRNVEGVMVDRKISRKLKGKVLDSCVVPASTYGLETLALSELHQHKLQVCENNWIRKIAGVRRVERRRMKDLREEVGSKACIVGKIVKSRMKWAGHMVRMNDDKLPKRAETKRQEGSRKRGRPQLRWEDCVKRDLRKAKEEEKWREKANNRDRWKLITKVAVLRSDQ